MKAALLAVIGMATAGQAAALSCLRPDVVRSFQEAQASQEVYSVVRGRFDAVTAANPDAARFEGWVLGQDGFVPVTPQTVVLRVSCDAATGGGCGTVPTGDEVIAFLRHGEDGLALDLGPCPRWVFGDPGPEESRLLTECMIGGECEPGAGNLDSP